MATAWRTLALLRPGDYRLARADSRWSSGGLEFADDTAALGWLESERANLLAAVQQAAASPGVLALPIGAWRIGHFSFSRSVSGLVGHIGVSSSDNPGDPATPVRT